MSKPTAPRYDTVWAFDPGKETGCGWMARGRETQLTHMPEDMAMDHFDEMVCTYPSHARGLVLCESIVITQQTSKKSSDVHASLRQIGHIHHAIRRLENLDLLMQAPSEAKSFGTDEKLRACGLWYVGSDHPRDAARHLVLGSCALIPGFAQQVMDRLREPSDDPVGFPPE